MRFMFASLALMSVGSLLMVNVALAQVTFLDKYLSEYRSLRHSLFNFIGRSDGQRSYNWNLKKQVMTLNVFSSKPKM